MSNQSNQKTRANKKQYDNQTKTQQQKRKQYDNQPEKNIKQKNNMTINIKTSQNKKQDDNQTQSNW